MTYFNWSFDMGFGRLFLLKLLSLLQFLFLLRNQQIHPDMAVTQLAVLNGKRLVFDSKR